MNRMQRGFTLIELVMVIVIIGILAAIAIPKFVDLSGEANQAAVNGVAGALSSAAAVNYAARKAGNSNGAAMLNCTTVATMLQGGALPTGYTITAAVIAAEATATCTLTGQGSKTATFSATGVS
jgi:prepilin-type N-terminal cleavage/methylation domain-containing protein